MGGGEGVNDDAMRCDAMLVKRPHKDSSSLQAQKSRLALSLHRIRPAGPTTFL